MANSINENTDFFEGYKLALENAQNHLAVAEASVSISIGIANSHLILASEEAIKSAMLFQLSFDKDTLEEAQADIDKYFSSHKHKHEAIRGLEFFGGLMSNMLELRFSPFKDIDPQTITDEEFKQKKDEGFDNIIQWLESLLEDKSIFDTNQDWWKQADSQKNRGFYISLLKKKGQWDGPFSITKKQYNKGKKIVTEFVSRISEIKDFFDNPEMVKIYKEMKKEVFQKKKK